MDCVYARWLTDLSDGSIIHPATECGQNFDFRKDACPKRIDICDTIKVELIPFNGFLWSCPGCSKSNNASEQSREVTCKICGRQYQTKITTT